MLSDAELIGEEVEEETVEEETVEVSGDESILEGEQEEVESSEELEDSEEEVEEEVETVYTVKIDGEEVEVSLEQLQQGYTHGKAADAKFRDAAFARKQAEEFVSMLKTDPWKVLNDPSLGIDTRKMAEEYLARQMEHEALTDDERELLEARKQLAQFETSRKEQEQSNYDRQMTELEGQYHDEYTVQISTALEEDGLPVTEATVRRMASYMSEALTSDNPAVKSLTAKDITALVREDYMTDFKSMFGSADAETLQAILGDDLTKTLRKADVQKLTSRNNRTKKPVKKASGKSKTVNKSFNQNTFDNFLDSI